MSLESLLLVAAGAAFGGVGRYWLGRLLPELYGTLAANTIACFLLGIITSAETVHLSPGTTLLAGMGFSGALSTWSTLAKELGELIRTGQNVRALRYGVATIVLGILAVLSASLVF
ncbi:FluC/FEX family fluoride channel [Corynebacterium meridianum]|uniref:Fluoride-specific ion channel FluC n=1 Tax=Corynebacterium meridianum TaxID=2765363 RepID=A0A934HY80_9CORY|nr:CrcB family protein [Corynebacterium meridianum]MBI8988782.1 CrcB family protein [Corynebacterium meridianum]MCK7677253.1 CrcB family protein [Corynebacterium meridianum]